MAELINRTEVLCPACRIPHPARLLLRDGEVIGVVDCPAGRRETVLSGHGELFLRFRRLARFTADLEYPAERPCFFHYLSITDDCNCRCPICFAAAEPGSHQKYLSLAEAEEAGRTAVRNRARTVVLVGGEPTLHPQLLDLVALLRRAGLGVWIATNGLRLAAEPGLARRLKDAGVAKVCLQLDTFEAATHQAIRGHALIEEKLAAARAIRSAGMILGLVCTVTSHNLPELPAYCRRVLAWPDPPQTIAIQAAGHAGRLQTDADRYITREEIVTTLAAGQAVAGLTEEHFWPIPVFRPLSIFAHPDCAANTVAVITGGGAEPLARYVDVEKLLRLAGESPECPSPWGRRCAMAGLALRSLRLRGWLLALRHGFSRLLGGRGVRITFIGTGAFLRPDFADLERIRRCASGLLTPEKCESLCAFYLKEPISGIGDNP